jgi:hypothetical protein
MSGSAPADSVPDQYSASGPPIGSAPQTECPSASGPIIGSAPPMAEDTSNAPHQTLH